MPVLFDIQTFDLLDSTNQEVLRQAEAGAKQGLVVVAKQQTAGKGRLGRSWLTLDDALAFSVLLRPQIPTRQVSELSLLTAVALHQCLQPYIPDIGLKWPNDVLIHGKKVCGILTEMRSRSGHDLAVVLGIGINVFAPAHGWPSDILQPATDLQSHTSQPLKPATILASFLAELSDWLDIYAEQGFAPIRQAWWRAHIASGKPVKVYDGQGYIQGLAVGLASDGALRLLVNGEEQRIIAGDVTLND